MASSVIHAGICGFVTRVEAHLQGDRCLVAIASDCQHIRNLAEHIVSVDPFQEISFHGQMPTILQQAAIFCTHAACPVPAGIIKAVEVAAGLALPADVSIRIANDPLE